ncbi:MAG: putative quinol monooxygenase [Terriglobales bacterium]|jgi:quinol monooxygenase YgiN
MLASVLRLSVKMTAHEGQLEKFKAIARQMTEASGAEPGTLGYEWFTDGGSRFRLEEVYTGADAVLAHFMGTAVRTLVPQLAALCTIDGFEIYGDPGPLVTQIAAGFGAEIFPYWIGLSR